MSHVADPKQIPNSRGAPLTPAEREALSFLVRKIGEREVVRRLGLTRHTLARAMAGLGVYPPTAFLIRNSLAAAVVPAVEPSP